MNTPTDRITQLSPVKRALLALEEMQTKLDTIEHGRTEPIAVIGMGCRFPLADSPEAFWQLLRDGVDAVSEIPSSRWDVDAYYDPDPDVPGKMYSRWGAFLKNIETFDPGFFGIAPREALSLDPQQRLLLEVTWEALERAGQTSEKLAGTRTGVFVGMMNNEYFQHIKQSGFSNIDAYYGTGNVPSSASGRLSYILGLHGPSMTIDTACSTSLVTTHLACQSLRQGECDLALSSGVNLILLPDVNIYMCKAKTISPDGRCKTFDASANGYVRGEGCGVVVLKRLSDALADGDNILALIRGSAVNHDGRSGGFTVPSGSAQQELVGEALARAGVKPSEVSYVEAHGTGTPLGDPIEVRALGAVLNRERLKPFAVGSVKTNIGHLEAAAGIAGLIKVVLALQHEEIPPHLHVTEVNPQISLEEAGAVIPTKRISWPRTQEGRRIAGVSSFGLTGTIAHAILEEPPRPTQETSKDEPDEIEDTPRVLTLSGREGAALEALARVYRDYLQGESDNASLRDVCYAAGVRRTHHEHRLAIVGRTRQEMAAHLDAHLCGERLPAIAAGRKFSGHIPKVVFVYPGQGSQWIGMGRQLLASEKVFRESLERCEREMRKHVTWSLLTELNADEPHSRLHEIDVVQPVLFAIQVALTELWKSWGIEPDAVVGQSMGEVAAAYVAGALSLEDALRVICRRSLLLKQMSGRGAMAAVELSLEQMEVELKGYEDRLSVAVSNSPTSTVVSGEPGALTELLAELQSRDIFCRMVKVDVASHSPQMEALHDELLQALEGLRTQSLSVPICSTVTGDFRNDVAFDAAYWWRNLREPVLFSAAIQKLLESGYEAFLEISPHPITLSTIQQGLYHAGREGTLLPSLRRAEDEPTAMLRALGGLYATGHPVNWDIHFPQKGGYVQLPSYQWQHKRFWVEAEQANDGAARKAARRYVTPAGGTHPLVGYRYEPARSPLRHVWELSDASSALRFLKEHRVQDVAIFPGAAYVEMVLAAASEIYGETPISLFDVAFHSALFLAEDGGRTIQLTFSEEASGEVEFHIYSRTEGAEHIATAWTLHASGRIRIGREAVAQQAAELDSPEIVRERCEEELTGEAFYALMSERGNLYGPSFRGVQRLWRLDDEAVARLQLPAGLEAQAKDYFFHPAILDTCLQTLGAAIPKSLTQDDPTSPCVPVGIEQVRVRRASGNYSWSYARLRSHEGVKGTTLKGDVYLLDVDGQVAIELLGVQLQFLKEGLPVAARSLDDWLYELQWQSKERAAATELSSARAQEDDEEGARGSWLIWADRGGVANAVATLLEARDESCVLVVAGDEFERLDEKHFRIRPESREDVQRLLAEASGAGDFKCRGIVHLWSLDIPSPEETTHESLRQAQALGCGSTLMLVQALAQVSWPTPPRLWLVTQGAQPFEETSFISTAQAPLWGFGRTLAQELPYLFGALVDLDAADNLDPIDGASLMAVLLCEEITEPDAESQIAFRQGQRFVGRLVRQRQDERSAQPLRWHTDGSYLITGGLGDLGCEVAHWMVAQGARRLIVLNRTPLPPRAAWAGVEPDSRAAKQIAAIRQLEALGASVHVAAVDVTDETQLGDFLAEFRREGWPQIRGVVHAAGVLDDRTVLNLDLKALDTTWRPKVIGSWLLHRLLQDAPLDFFVLFSSGASLLGSPGQANYAAANSYMDALAHYRRSKGRPALSINWVAWAEVGLAAQPMRGGRLALRGFGSIEPRQGIEILERLLKQEAAQVGVLPLDWTLLRRFNPAVADAPLFSQLNEENLRENAEAAGAQQDARISRASLLAAGADERRRLLEDYLSELVAKILGVASTALDRQTPLNMLGLDSLMAIEFKNAVQSSIGVVLPMVSIMRGPSTAQLMRQVLDLLETDLGPIASVFPNEFHAVETASDYSIEGFSPEDAEQLLARLDELSIEEVDRLLAHVVSEEVMSEEKVIE